MSGTDTVSRFVERIERLAEIDGQIADVYAEAQAAGVNADALRAVIEARGEAKNAAAVRKLFVLRLGRGPV